MTLLEAIEARHSVRKYKDSPIPEEILTILRNKIWEVNKEAGLHVQLVTDEPKAYRGVMAYGSFSGVKNYFVMAGKKGEDLDEKIGYYGEQLVLLAQTLGLNTCWTGLSYSKIPGTYELEDGEKIGFKDFSKVPKVTAKPVFSMIGYSKMDLGIIKYHFELGAGKENFEWL